MSSTALQRDALMPRSPDGMGRGLMLALIAHALLVVALAFSVNWRASEPAGIEAELWAATPQFAAPRATAPEPAPAPPEVKRPVPVPAPEPPVSKAPDPQIAIEKARKEEARREEQKREECDQPDRECRALAQFVFLRGHCLGLHVKFRSRKAMSLLYDPYIASSGWSR